MEGKESDNKDIEVGVNIDSPMPINILGRAIDMKPFAGVKVFVYDKKEKIPSFQRGIDVPVGSSASIALRKEDYRIEKRK